MKTIILILLLFVGFSCQKSEIAKPIEQPGIVDLSFHNIAAETIVDLGVLDWDTETSFIDRSELSLFSMDDINLYINDVRYRGFVSVYIYKNDNDPVYFGDYDLFEPNINISGVCPFDINKDDNFILEFRL